MTGRERPNAKRRRLRHEHAGQPLYVLEVDQSTRTITLGYTDNPPKRAEVSIDPRGPDVWRTDIEWYE